jgi:hypothetical protein
MTPVIVSVAVAVIAPLIAAVHVNGNATVDVVEKADLLTLAQP